MTTTLRRHEMFIGGKWTPGTGDAHQEIVNPATGKVIAHVPRGTDHDVDRAVAAARKAYDEVWFDSTPRDRSERMILNNYRALRFMRDELGGALSPESVLELHRIVTDGTLDDPKAAEIEQRVTKTIDDALEFAMHAPDPAPEEAVKYVYA